VSERQPVDAVTEEFVATARSDVVQVEIDGEIVLYDDQARVMHRLSPTAGQVWRCLDGSGSLAEIAADLADVYQVDPALVLSEVVATARNFAMAGLLVGVGEPSGQEDAFADGEHDPTQDVDGPFIFEVATGMDAAFPLDVAGLLTVQAGPYLLGMRFSTPELVEMAKDVFAPSLVEGVVAPPNVSVKVTASRAGRALLYCYRSTILVTRARSTRRALEAAARLLSSFVPPHDGAVRVGALTAVRSDVVVLFGPECWPAATRLVPRLRAAGWEVLDAPEVDLDREGNVVLPPLAVALDSTALARTPTNSYDGTRPAPGRYKAAAWLTVSGEDPTPKSTAGRVARIAAGIPSLDPDSAPSAFDAISAMLQGATWAVSPSVKANELMATLADVVE
jgi:hypothetical protein